MSDKPRIKQPSFQMVLWLMVNPEVVARLEVGVDTTKSKPEFSLFDEGTLGYIEAVATDSLWDEFKNGDEDYDTALLDMLKDRDK